MLDKQRWFDRARAAVYCCLSKNFGLNRFVRNSHGYRLVTCVNFARTNTFAQLRLGWICAGFSSTSEWLCFQSRDSVPANARGSFQPSRALLATFGCAEKSLSSSRQACCCLLHDRTAGNPLLDANRSLSSAKRAAGMAREACAEDGMGPLVWFSVRSATLESAPSYVGFVVASVLLRAPFVVPELLPEESACLLS